MTKQIITSAEENFIFENGKPDRYLFSGGYYTYAAPSNSSAPKKSQENNVHKKTDSNNK